MPLPIVPLLLAGGAAFGLYELTKKKGPGTPAKPAPGQKPGTPLGATPDAVNAAVMNALKTETNPDNLDAFADSLGGNYPQAVALLRARAQQLRLAKQQPGVPMPQPAPAPAPAPYVAPVMPPPAPAPAPYIPPPPPPPAVIAPVVPAPIIAPVAPPAAPSTFTANTAKVATHDVGPSGALSVWVDAATGKSTPRPADDTTPGVVGMVPHGAMVTVLDPDDGSGYTHVSYDWTGTDPLGQNDGMAPIEGYAQTSYLAMQGPTQLAYGSSENTYATSGAGVLAGLVRQVRQTTAGPHSAMAFSPVDSRMYKIGTYPMQAAFPGNPWKYNIGQAFGRTGARGRFVAGLDTETATHGTAEETGRVLMQTLRENGCRARDEGAVQAFQLAAKREGLYAGPLHGHYDADTQSALAAIVGPGAAPACFKGPRGAEGPSQPDRYWNP